MVAAGNLQDELEALRRELRQIPRVAGDEDMATGAAAATAPAGDMRAEIERVLRELQDRLGEVTDDAENLVAAHPFASVAVGFLLGVLVANVMSRER